jgi:site-specific DNA recombinase
MEAVNKQDLKCVVLARVSTREQEETGFSLPAQRKLLHEYAERNDFLVSKTYEISETASKSQQRIVFQQMMAYMGKHKVRHLVCEKVDRMVRNFKDTVLIDEWLEADEGRKVHFVKDSLVLHRNSRSQEKLNWGMRVVIAKNFIDNLREEVEKGRRAKLEEGWLPGTPPLGYRNALAYKRSVQEIDPERASLVRTMFELYDTGNNSIKSLVSTMNGLGLRMPRGGKISPSQAHRILRSRYYIGIIDWDGREYTGKHPMLIDKALFERVQRRLTGKTTPKV